jgi:hypothetical protein
VATPAMNRPTPEHIINLFTAFQNTAALNSGITVEFVPNEDRVSPPVAAGFSLIMLAGTDVGDAYTLSEYEKMFGNAGFGKTTLQLAPDLPQQVLVTEKAE